MPLPSSYAARLFSWVDVPTSAFAFSVGASLLVAHGLLGYTLAGVAAQSAVVALLASAGVVLYNAVMEGKALPPPRIPVHPDTLARASTVAGERAAAALARSNELLSWRDMGASARALAYAWLVYRFSWLLSPRVLIAGWVAAFVATPAYAAASAPVDAALARHVLPLVATIQSTYASLRTSLTNLVSANQGLAYAVGSVLSLLVLYVLGGVLSVSQLFTVASSIVLVADLCDAPRAAAGAAAGGKPIGRTQ